MLTEADVSIRNLIKSASSILRGMDCLDPKVISLLFVEDNESDFILAKHLLQHNTKCNLTLCHRSNALGASTQFLCDRVKTVKEAEEVIPALDYDLYVLDLCLSDGDPFTLVKNMDSKGINFPFVIRTGSCQSEEVIQMALEAGALSFMCKDDSPCCLINTIRFAVRNYREKQIALKSPVPVSHHKSPVTVSHHN